MARSDEGGKNATGHGNRYLARTLGEAAVVVGRTDTFLGERYRRIATWGSLPRAWRMSDFRIRRPRKLPHLLGSPGFALVDGEPFPELEPVGLLGSLPAEVLAAANMAVGDEVHDGHVRGSGLTRASPILPSWPPLTRTDGSLQDRADLPGVLLAKGDHHVPAVGRNMARSTRG
jgi:hypothetical protein